MTFKYSILSCFLLCSIEKSLAQSTASIKAYKKSYVTYPFSDPDPIPSQTAIYPYFRFDGFTNTPINKEWTVVELENDYSDTMLLSYLAAVAKTAKSVHVYSEKFRGAFESGKSDLRRPMY